MSSTVNRKWLLQSSNWRDDLDVSKDWNPWTDAQNFSGRGLNRNCKRVVDLVNCTAIDACKRRKLNPAKVKDMQRATQDLILDFSQCHNRKCFSNTDGVAKCLTTASTLYSFRYDRVLLPVEHMYLQGHRKDIIIPSSFSPSLLRAAAGEGIAVPCLGLMVWCVFVTVGFGAKRPKSDN